VNLHGRSIVILLTRLGGAPFALNPDLIERADCTPDTVITLVDGTKYVVAESLPELMDLVLHFRARVVHQSQQLGTAAEAELWPVPDLTVPPDLPGTPETSVVVPLHPLLHPLPRRES
jgi:flagellar protein FlbD